MKVCDFASVVTSSVTGLTMALVVPASETVFIRRIEGMEDLEACGGVCAHPEDYENEAEGLED